MLNYKLKFYCHNCLTTFLMFADYDVRDFIPNCVHCKCGTEHVSAKGTVREDTYEVTYTWNVRAYSHDEARDTAVDRGFFSYDGCGSRRLPHD